MLLGLHNLVPFKPIYWANFMGSHTLCRFCRKRIWHAQQTIVCPYQKGKNYRFCSVHCYEELFRSFIALRLYGISDKKKPEKMSYDRQQRIREILLRNGVSEEEISSFIETANAEF